MPRKWKKNAKTFGIDRMLYGRFPWYSDMYNRNPNIWNKINTIIDIWKVSLVGNFGDEKRNWNNLDILIPGPSVPYTKDALKQLLSADHWYYQWCRTKKQPFVVSQAHNLLFQCQKEVDEEECQCIHVLLFSVLFDSTRCNEIEIQK